jgi:IS605 OrfB family transposase
MAQGYSHVVRRADAPLLYFKYDAEGRMRMVVEARRTVRIPLEVPADRIDDLHATSHRYRSCQNRAVSYCWPRRPSRPDDLVTSTREVQRALYDQLREGTAGLHSNLVKKAIKDAVAAVSSCRPSWSNGDRISKPSFDVRKDGSYTMTYDKRAATFRRYAVSLATVNGRMECRYRLPEELPGTPYDRYVLDRRWSFATSKLVYDGEQFWLHAVMKRTYSDVSPSTTTRSDTSEDLTRVLGVDVNVDGYTAVTWIGGFHGNADELNHRRRAYETLRGELQQTGTRSAHRRLQDQRGVERRYYRQYCHDVANEIVAEAVRVGATHVVFEELAGIRERISNRAKFQQWLFGRLQEYTKYKLAEHRIKFERVNPRETSRACSRTDCECVDEESRSGKSFRCVNCGYAVNADYNAARNIGLRFLEKFASVPTSHTCSSGRATSQLALMSGTLTPAGTYVSREWGFTDKPTASAVGH